MQFCVAIDGPAAAGKGTIARGVAKTFGFAYLDTGLLYRATAKRSIAGEDPIAVALSLSHYDLEADGLRSAEIGQEASRVSAIPEVRAALVDFQKEFAARDGGAVLDGRDIGTVICPTAEIKFFVTASDEVRAHRRWMELRAMGQDLPYDFVLEDLRKRDARDSSRATAPLAAAQDAIVLDTSEMSISEVRGQVFRLIGKKAISLAS